MDEVPIKPQLLSIKELITMLKLSKTTIYTLLKNGQFPQPFMQGNRCTRWRISDIENWLAQQRTVKQAN